MLNNIIFRSTLIAIVIPMLLQSSLCSASTEVIQNFLLEGDFAEASDSVNQRLINDPNDSEARIYKLLSDLGQFFESDIPNYLVAHLNAKERPTQQLFDYSGEKIIFEHKDIESFSSIPKAPNFQSLPEGLQIQYILDGYAHQSSASIDNDITIVSMTKYFPYGESMITSIRIEGLEPGKRYRFQGQAQIVSYDNSDDGGFIKIGFSDRNDSQIILRNNILTDFSTEISMPENETKNWVEFGISAGSESATGTLTAIFKGLKIFQLPHAKASGNMLEIPINDADDQIINYWLTPIDSSNPNPTDSQTASYFNFNYKSKGETPFEQGLIMDSDALINRLYSRISNDGKVDIDNDGAWDILNFTDTNANGQWDAGEDIEYKNVLNDPNLMTQLWDSVQAELLSESDSTDSNTYLINDSDRAALTLEYLGDSPQLNYFTIQHPNNSYHTIYIYINGAYIGNISDGSFYSDILKENGGYLNLGDLNNSDTAGSLNNDTLPIYMRPGDKISFKHSYSYTYNSPPYKPEYDYSISNQINNLYNSQNWPTLGIQINNPSQYLVSNGSFVEGFYDFGADLSTDSVLDFFKGPNQPIRSLLETIIDNLASFENGDTVTLDTDFTGYPQAILVEYPDALMLKSLAQYVYLSLQDLNKYNWDIAIPDDILIDDNTLEDVAWELENFLGDPGGIDFSTSIFQKHKDFLEIIPENLFEQEGYKAGFLSALEGFKEAIQLIWERGESGSSNACYLIEISDSFKTSENQSYDRLLLAIDSLISATDDFANIDDLVGEESANSSFKYSLAPLFQTDPYDLKKAILEVTDLVEAEDDLTLSYFINKGFISEIFPNDFYGNMLVFYEGDTVVAVEAFDETMDFEPLRGYLDSSWDNRIFEDAVSRIQLKRTDDYSATWSYDTYDYNLDSEVKRTGTVYIYKNILDLDNDGTMDALENTDNLDFESTLSNEQIQTAMNALFAPVTSLKGYIQLYEDYKGSSNNYYYEPEVEIQGYYYISNNDAIWEDEEAHYEYRYNEGTETMLDINLNYDPAMNHNYDIEGRVHTSPQNYYGNLENHQPHYIQYRFEDAYSGEFYDGRETRSFVIYPATVDLDKDGLADGQGILAHVEPSFSRLPTTDEIIEAINSEAAGAESEESNIQPANFTDNDQDGMPDALENKWTVFTGGHSNNSNDANLTYDFLLTDVYSYSQLMDLRLGSTLYEVNQGAASLNIILEESTDLNNWEPYGEYSLELSDDGNSNTKFFRFKMAD